MVITRTPPLPHWSPRSTDLRTAEIDIEIMMHDVERLASSVSAMKADIHLLHERLTIIEDHRSYWAAFMMYLWLQMKDGFKVWRGWLFGRNALPAAAGASAATGASEEHDMEGEMP